MSRSAPALDPTVRLRIATRIHFALLRHYGEQVAVSTLLEGGEEAREALWVCEASGDADLEALAVQFARVARTAEPAPEPGTPQDAVWAQDTSGFGVSRPADEREPAQREAARRTPALGRWLSPSRWLRQGGAPR
jgi:hypothetical protein